MSKKHLIITPLALLILGFNTNLYSLEKQNNQNNNKTQTTNHKITLAKATQTTNPKQNQSQAQHKKKAFTEFYNEMKHVNYKMGGTGGRKGIDCSAFTQKMFKEKFNLQLPRTTVTQVNIGKEIKKSELIPGDLVFFKTSKVDKHVGVYVGNGEFLHASIKGIQYTKLDKPFYKDAYWTSRRVIQ